MQHPQPLIPYSEIGSRILAVLGYAPALSRSRKQFLPYVDLDQLAEVIASQRLASLRECTDVGAVRDRVLAELRALEIVNFVHYRKMECWRLIDPDPDEEQQP